MHAPPDSALPEFDAPPVAEVALGVQLRPLLNLRPIELAQLRDQWRAAYPVVQEQPPLPPSIEAEAGQSPAFQLVLGPTWQSRLWFLSEDQTALVQVQHNRFAVNWRRIGEGTYPRYPFVRAAFEARFTEFRDFVQRSNLGEIQIIQVDATYINAIPTRTAVAGDPANALASWRAPQVTGGSLEQARTNFTFRLDHIGTGPVRLHVVTDVGQGPIQQPSTFLTLTVQGAPAGPSLADALDFMDGAHAQIVRSFTELTPDAMHKEWRRVR